MPSHWARSSTKSAPAPSDPLLLLAGLVTVMPVIGVVTDRDFVARPDPREVAGVFEVPLSLILARTALNVGYFERHGSRILTYELLYGGRRIWGATAAVLRNFQDVVLDATEN